MRPSDENQYGSIRPNLISPHRRGGEESILSRLERSDGRARPTFALPRRALAGLAAVLVVVALIWAWQLAGRAPAAAPAAVLRPAPVAQATPAPAAARATPGAAIVDSIEPPPLNAPIAPVAAPVAPSGLVAPPPPALVADAGPVAPRARSAPAPMPVAPRALPAASRASPPRRTRAEVAEPGLDHDVALISAILRHTAGKAPELPAADKPPTD